MTRFLPAVGWFAALMLLSGNLLAQASKDLPPPLPFPRLDPPPRPQEAPLQPIQAPRLRSPEEAKAHAEKIYSDLVGPALKNACYSCHSDSKASAGLNLQRLKPDFMSAESGELWRRVYERLRDKEMPPSKPGEVLYAPGSQAEASRRIVVDAIQQPVFDAQRLKAEALERGGVPPPPIREGDSRVVRLRKQMRDTAWQHADVVRQIHRSGRMTLDQALTAELMVLESELDLATTRQERVAALTKALAAARAVEDIVYSQYSLEIYDKAKFTQAKNARLLIQLQLQTELEKK